MPDWVADKMARSSAFARRRRRWLPKYAPELNDIEVVWPDLKAHHLAHQTFTNADALDRAIHTVTTLNIERNVEAPSGMRLGFARRDLRQLEAI
jgi:transposase